VTRYPSVWRDTGCKSHFIVWRSKIYWCDWHERLEGPPEQVVIQTQSRLNDDFVAYISIADELGQVPWAVLSACWVLVRRGLAESGNGKQSGMFKRRQPP
jgi:hypothetical protein